MVQENPLGITRLSEDLAIWRDESGKPHVIADRCPHRGARLSLGWNLGDRLACWYHGVEVNHDGVVVRVPAQEKCLMLGKPMVRSYPTQEVQGAIFAYFGDEQQPDPVDLQLPLELTDDAYSSFLCTALWRCNYRYAIDNVMDPMHGAYLHAKSHSMSMGDKCILADLSPIDIECDLACR
jgi:phenylpropionate dioxygenase-like ring-hydroxylating dioxygenase large terminal subunit